MDQFQPSVSTRGSSLDLNVNSQNNCSLSICSRVTIESQRHIFVNSVKVKELQIEKKIIIFKSMISLDFFVVGTTYNLSQIEVLFIAFFYRYELSSFFSSYTLFIIFYELNTLNMTMISNTFNLILLKV